MATLLPLLAVLSDQNSAPPPLVDGLDLAALLFEVVGSSFLVAFLGVSFFFGVVGFLLAVS